MHIKNNLNGIIFSEKDNFHSNKMYKENEYNNFLKCFPVIEKLPTT